MEINSFVWEVRHEQHQLGVNFAPKNKGRAPINTTYSGGQEGETDYTVEVREVKIYPVISQIFSVSTLKRPMFANCS